MRHSKPLIVALDITPLADQAKTGVGYYTQQLLEILMANPDIKIIAHSFGSVKNRPTRSNIRYIESGRVAKLAYYGLRKLGIRLPFEWLIRSRTDVQIFPNFVRWPSLRGTPQIVVVHDMSFLDCADYVQEKNRQFLRRFVGRDVRRVKRIIAVSNFTKERIESNYGVQSELISVIPIAAPVFGVPTKPSAGYFLHLGTLEPRKNYAGLIEGYLKLSPELRKKHPLILAGKAQNPDDELLDGQLEDEGVKILGYVDELTRAKLLAEALAICSASFYEGFGMPILEAFEFNKPLILSNIPPFREVAGNAAIYFDPTNPHSIHQAFAELLKGTRTAELIKHIPERLKAYDIDSVGQKLNTLVEEVGR